ncbi:signal recognition particle, SRP9/SRP14 subunit [Trichoderma citrinoviride]|uniref:Signal recognition particle subunit SRP14 n=1 Tax=Trichoderma citrinoviride TaxID=58853 RepID=A0A2T4AZI1_9HYPO|nr:signal recognition particle, SRP9/SRP14 subunit [Trichoderma citrinoviride]PTB62477.1 signal recognition particle, SRP9/SRP14 subunit [Trichoderma citrinoviride]
MASQHLSQDEFFDKLGHLFNHRKGSDHGAIYLTQKRLTYDPAEQSTTAKLFPDLAPNKPLPVLVRATNGKSKRDARAGKEKLSVVVQPHELDAFYARYADVCKAGMAALKPRDKSKKRAKAKKKKAAS